VGPFLSSIPITDLETLVSQGEWAYGDALMSPFLGNHDVNRFFPSPYVIRPRPMPLDLRAPAHQGAASISLGAQGYSVFTVSR